MKLLINMLVHTYIFTTYRVGAKKHSKWESIQNINSMCLARLFIMNADEIESYIINWCKVLKKRQKIHSDTDDMYMPEYSIDRLFRVRNP